MSSTEQPPERLAFRYKSPMFWKIDPEKPPYYHYSLLPRFIQILLPARESEICVAGDLPSNPLIQAPPPARFAAMTGASTLPTLRIMHLSLETKTSFVGILRIERFRKDLFREFIHGFFGGFKFGYMFSIAALGYSHFFREKEMVEDHAAHNSLVTAEKEGQIRDLRKAFGEKNFRKLQEARSVDFYTYVTWGIMAPALLALTSIKKGILLHWRVSRLTFVFVMSIDNDGSWPRHYYAGGFEARKRLVSMRQEKWQKSESSGEGNYEGGDHLTWLRKYREAQRQRIDSEMTLG